MSVKIHKRIVICITIWSMYAFCDEPMKGDLLMASSSRSAHSAAVLMVLLAADVVSAAIMESWTSSNINLRISASAKQSRELACLSRYRYELAVYV